MSVRHYPVRHHILRRALCDDLSTCDSVVEPYDTPTCSWCLECIKYAYENQDDYHIDVVEAALVIYGGSEL